MAYLPLHGDAAKASQDLIALVTEIVGSPSIAQFRVSQTRDIASVREAIGCNHMFVLYSSECQVDADRVEKQLIQAFSSHAKRIDAAASDDGKRSTGSNWYVIVAIWLKM